VTGGGAAAGTWHYGLVARWWAEAGRAEPEELAYYRAVIARFGEPALDLGCGTGRLLVPLAADGVDIDGADVSADMLGHALAAGRTAGVDLAGRLSRTTFHDLDVPRRYRTVVCCDSFGIGGSRERDEAALRRVHACLEPGGAFVVSMDVPPPDPGWSLAPSDWPAARPRARLADGDELELRSRTAAWDPATAVETMEIRALLWHDDALVAEETGTLHFTWYRPDELRAMLAAAGFADVAVEGRYTGRPADPGDETVVMVARRVE
jgi:SAM-dependent methyltransferase